MTLCAPAFNNTFESNALTGLGSVIVLSLSLILLIGSLDYLKSQKLPIFELSILLLLLVAGLCALMKVKSVFTLYLCIEWQSIILYISICFIKVSVYAIEASLIYYIFSVFLTLLLLFGVSILYYTVGTLDFNSLKILFSVPLEE
jgi:multicomponent Na+:H+ antiporter subunit D